MLFRSFRQPLPTDKPVNAMEIRSSFNSMAALKRLRGLYNKESLQYEGDYKLKEAAKDLLEGTSGVAAGINFDLLTTTDRPFRQAVMTSEASGMARRLGIAGLDHEKFVNLPQKGIEKWARENISDPAARAQKIKELKEELTDSVAEGLLEADVKIGSANITKGANRALNWMAKTSPTMSILVHGIAPFVRIPLNFAAVTFKLANPEMSGISFLYNASRGNTKKAAIDFSIFATGATLAYAGAQLYNMGVIQTTDSPQTKAQRLSGELGRAGSINLSKLKRMLNGGSAETMPGDDIRRLDRFGLIGVALLNEADKQEALKKKNLLTGKVSFADKMITRFTQLPISLAYTLNQTFTKNIGALIDGLMQGGNKAEKFLQNVFSSSFKIGRAHV